MEDTRHPDQRLLSPEVQQYWLDFLASEPSSAVLHQEIVSQKPWKAEAAAELLQRSDLSNDCLQDIVEHVPECRERADRLLQWRLRHARSNIEGVGNV